MASNFSAAWQYLLKRLLMLESEPGLPDGTFLHQNVNFLYILEGLGKENFVIFTAIWFILCCFFEQIKIWQPWFANLAALVQRTRDLSRHKN
jgi:hypothetical protein